MKNVYNFNVKNQKWQLKFINDKFMVKIQTENKTIISEVDEDLQLVGIQHEITTDSEKLYYTLFDE